MKAASASALVLLFLLAWEACAERERDFHYRSLQAQSVGASEVEDTEEESPVLAGVAAAARIRRERERRAKAQREQREKREREWKERQRREEEARRVFRMKNTIDCIWNEEWGSWGECSASCGGGVRTRTLVSLVVTQKQDKHRFGRACPTECSGAACSEQAFQACNVEICDIDCSTIDLGNHLSSGGVAAKWVSPRLEGQCVFQFWQVLESNDELKVMLLGETQPPDADVYSFGSSRDPVIISSSQASSVVLGYRGCTLQGLPNAASPTGKVCLYEDPAFQEHSQTATLNIKQREALHRLRRNSNINFAGQLSSAATSALGYSLKGVAFMDKPTRLALPPSFSLSATMDLSVPAPPRIQQVLEDGDDVLITAMASATDGGAVVTAYTAAVRKLFGYASLCEFTSLPECLSGNSNRSPCTEVSTSTNQVSLVLRNLQLASNYEVKVKALNAAGASPQSKSIKVSTRAAPGVPKSECAVDAWFPEDDDARALRPMKDDVECQLQTPPLAGCVMKPRTTRFSEKTKCDGKKYWRRFKPLMSAGDQDCVEASFNPMKVCEHDLAVFDLSKEARRCSATGCGASSLPWLQKHCCCEAADDFEADSPSCACIQGSCSELGLFEAKDAKLSCRH